MVVFGVVPTASKTNKQINRQTNNSVFEILQLLEFLRNLHYMFVSVYV